LQKGVIYGLMAGLVWSVTNLATRFGLAGFPLPMTALTVAGAIPVVPLAVFLVLTRSDSTFTDLRRSQRLIGGCVLSGLGQVTLFAALSFAPTVYVVPTYNLKSLVTVFLAFALIPKSEKLNMKVVLGALLAIGGIVLINLQPT